MNVIYRFKIKTHPAYETKHVDFITMFYDDEEEVVIDYMQKYDKQNGFTFTDRHGRCNTCADFILSKETPTGEIIKQMTYREIFDHLGNRLQKDKAPGRRKK